MSPIYWLDSSQADRLPSPSGSGKSTLLNVLAHRTAAMTANIQAGIYLSLIHISEPTRPY